MTDRKFIRDENNLVGFTISSRDQTSKGYWESLGLANPGLLVVLSTLGTQGHLISLGVSFPKQEGGLGFWCQGWMQSWLWWDGEHAEPCGCSLVKRPWAFMTQHGLRMGWESQRGLGPLYLLIPANVLHSGVPSSFRVLSEIWSAKGF